MAPVSTRSAVLADPEYVFDRFTPKKRRSSRRAVEKEDTLKKQKLDREKALNNKRDGLFSDSAVLKHFGAEHVTGVKGCQDLMDKAGTKLLKLADEIESYNTPESEISENVRGDMEAFSGKARLLVTSKLRKQYQRMIDDALSPTYTPPTKVSDLTGFWEMVLLQLDQVDTDYADLLKLKENNWVEVEVVKPVVVPAAVLNPKVVNKPAVQKTNPKKTEMDKVRADRMKAFKAQMKAKKEAAKQGKENDENTFLVT